MTAGQAKRIERMVDGAAAAVLGLAVGYCALRIGLQLPVAAAVGGLIIAFSFALLRALPAFGGPYRVGDFALAELPAAPAELLLTEADRRPEVVPERSPELLLDDVLAELGPDSRVVHLFDRAAMPTPAELRARIDRHLDHEAVAIDADASRALHEALAELRRSLR